MNKQDLEVYARTIYGEARGEYSSYGPAALIAVANVIQNRFKKGGHFGETIQEVCLKSRQFSCWNKSDPNRLLLEKDIYLDEKIFILCKEVAEKVANGIWPDLTRDSDHYHATSVFPAWANHKKIKFKIGHHIFYKLD